MIHISPGMSKNKVNRAFTSTDTNSNGILSYEEFDGFIMTPRKVKSIIELIGVTTASTPASTSESTPTEGGHLGWSFIVGGVLVLGGIGYYFKT
jgi:hypothetical protein